MGYSVHEQQSHLPHPHNDLPHLPHPPHLIVVAPYFYPKIGGAENYAYNLARRLCEDKSYSVSIITSNYDANGYKQETIDGMTVHRLPVWFKISNTPINPLWYWQIKRIFARERPDIIHLHTPVPFIADIATLAAGRTPIPTPIPIVVTYHAGSMLKNKWPIDSIIYLYEKIFLYLLFRRADRIVPVSLNFLQNKWGKRFADKTEMIRPGIDTTYFTPTPLPTSTKVVTFVGRVEHSSYWKGIEQLLQAMVLVLETCPDTKLEIVGGGDAVEYYRTRSEELGIAHAVTFCGPLGGNDLLEAYQRSSVVVLPSTSEAEQSSVVLIEAMASGRPVIGTDIGGTPHIIDHEKNGILVPPNDSPALALAIEQILTDIPQAQILAAGGVASAQKVDWGVQVKKYKDLFTAVLHAYTQKQQHTTDTITHTHTTIPTPTPRPFPISRRTFLLGLSAWFGLFAVLCLRQYNPFHLLTVVGFLFLIIVPGTLTLLALRIRGLESGAYIGMVVGFSLIELISVGLIGNMFLPIFGIAHPLALPVLFTEVSLITAVLATVVWFRVPMVVVARERYLLFATLRDTALALTPFFFVLLAILGATRLNNGAGNQLTVFMLISMGIYVSLLVYVLNKKRNVGKYVVPIALYGMSLALLLMTSLRGWYITGHDVQAEFHVFELTRTQGVWLIQNYRDAYNACMSITVLPTIFANLLTIFDPYVYKVLFQIIFATVPGVIYSLVRKYVSTSIALLSAFYFIAFPTFFGDMPMLNRQEIAFVFLALMIYVIFEEKLTLRMRRVIFTILGFGMILSHYSTTYTVIALLLFLLVARPIVPALVKQLSALPLFQNLFQKSALLGEESVSNVPEKKLITLWMVLILITGSFLWTSVLTDTSSNSFSRVISKTLEAIRENTKDDARSTTVLYSLFSWNKPDPAKALIEYQDTVVTPARMATPTGTYYDSAKPTNKKYEVTTVVETNLPLTVVGKLFAFFGFDLSKFNYVVRQTSAKLLQVLILVGFLFAVFRNRFTHRFVDLEFSLLTVGSLLMVACQVALPVLSVEYGVLRAFQQSLMFLGMFVVIGSLVLFSRFKETTGVLCACLLAIVFFYATTGVLVQAVAQHPAQLHLDNVGVYYDNYYTHATDLAGIAWLGNNVPENGNIKVQTDRAEFHTLRSTPGIEVLNGIYPGFIRHDAYVFLGYANVHQQYSSLLWNSDVITYTYPTNFLDENKDLIYSNGSAKVYR